MSQVPPPGGFAPSAPQPTPYGGPGMPPPAPSNKTGSTLLIIGGVLLAFMLVCGGILAVLLLPAIQAAREASRRMQCSNNLKQIGLALHSYHADNRQFPPAYTTDAAGNRLHSWRTAILPYMEQQRLYDQIDMTKPWDHPVNQQAFQTVVPQYSCGSASLADPTMTTYVIVDDPTCVFSGGTTPKLRDILDGTSMTIMVVEAEEKDAVPWMSTDNIDMATFMQTPQPPGNQTSHSHTGGHHVLMSDGAVRFVRDYVDPGVKKALITKAGREEIDVEF